MLWPRDKYIQPLVLSSECNILLTSWGFLGDPPSSCILDTPRRAVPCAGDRSNKTLAKTLAGEADQNLRALVQHLSPASSHHKRQPSGRYLTQLLPPASHEPEARPVKSCSQTSMIRGKSCHACPSTVCAPVKQHTTRIKRHTMHATCTNALDLASSHLIPLS